MGENEQGGMLRNIIVMGAILIIISMAIGGALATKHSMSGTVTRANSEQGLQAARVSSQITAKSRNISDSKYNYQTDERSNTVSVIGPIDRTNTVVELPTTVTNSGKKYTVTSIGAKAFDDVGVTSLDLPDTIVSIGAEAFTGAKMTTLTLPGAVARIGHFAFSGDNVTKPSNLEKVTVKSPSQLTSIGDAAFAWNKIKSVDLPNSITFIGNQAFSGNKLTSVTLPTGIVSINRGAFSDNKLTSVTIPSSVASIEDDAFHRNKLTSVTIPSSVTSIDNGAFTSNNLRSVVVPNKSANIDTGAFDGSVAINTTVETAKLHAGHSYDNLFTAGVSGTVGAEIADSVSNHEGEFVHVLNKFNDQNGFKWAEIQLNGKNYYVAQDTLNYDIHYVRVFGLEDGVRVHLNNDPNAGVWTRPYGLNNAAYMESVDSIRENGSREFTVDKYAELFNQHWIHLKDTGWVISSTAKFQTKPWASNTTVKSTYSLAGFDGDTNMNSWYY